MKIARKALAVLTLAALLCGLVVTAAFAAENGSLWAAVEHDDGTTALIVTDTTVTDGLVKVTYDSSVLTYVSTEATAEYVAMYAVNAEEPGVVLISWVAPEAYELEGETVCLIQVNFSGVEEESSITLTGSAHAADGSEVTLADAPDTSGLEAAIEEAEALDESAYTEESWSGLETALAQGKEVLEDSTATQAEVDAAEEAIRSAMEALVKVGSGDGETESTEASTGTGTKPTEDSGENSQTGDESMVWVFVVIGVVSAVAIVILLILLFMPKKKKGRYAK